ncbi:unnamed protein product [Miscanthus lutarioriparius]|uniref:Uncharacterized protein n=1 Tax=Miscanthus lutarioriparius TaxID=422564 RepID=A0A811NZX2_9POAL|nr:unnamed protein product [Miscanthus lutarioriparius]
MRTRVRLFAEGVVKMVSPVLLALALRKVDLKGEGTLFVFVQRSISPIAAVTMAFGILLMVLIWLCLSKIFARVEWLQDAASKLLVLICAILLMWLAYFILLLISMDYKVYIAIVIPSVGFITYCYICSLRGETDDGVRDRAISSDDGGAQADYERELERSVDFFAAFTVLLFLGLERLALELHLNSNHEGHDHLESTLVVSFWTCVLGVAIMFVWTVPPSPSVSNDERSDQMRRRIEASNMVLALLIAAIVLCITWAPLDAYALLVIVPPLVSFFIGIYEHLDEAQDKLNRINPTTSPGSHDVVIEMQEQQQSKQPEGESQSQSPSSSQTENQWMNTTSSLPPAPDDDSEPMNRTPSSPPDADSEPMNTTSSSPPDDSEVKPPPPLELMKFSFAGFLTVSIPSIRDCSLTSSWTQAFILFTAISVVSALQWRLLSHRAETPRAVVLAANVASFFTHVFAVAALVPFAVMADMNARLVVPDCRG